MPQLYHEPHKPKPRKPSKPRRKQLMNHWLYIAIKCIKELLNCTVVQTPLYYRGYVYTFSWNRNIKFFIPEELRPKGETPEVIGLPLYNLKVPLKCVGVSVRIG